MREYSRAMHASSRASPRRCISGDAAPCRALALVALTLVLSCLFSPAAAWACGELRHAGAVRGPRSLGRAPLVIGDSTMIFAAPKLGRMGIEADAHGCRQFGEGISMLSARRHSGTLPAIAVLALGANGPIGPGQISRALSVLGRRRILGLVTPRRSPMSDARMRAAAHRHPDRVLLIDWVTHSAGNGQWFAGDGLHVDDGGATAYARLIRRTLAPLAFPPVRTLRLPKRIGDHRRCGRAHRLGRPVRVVIVRGEDRVTCNRARALLRRAPLHGLSNWTMYDWRRTGAGPWSWVLRRADARVVVAGAETRGR